MDTISRNTSASRPMDRLGDLSPYPSSAETYSSLVLLPPAASPPSALDHLPRRERRRFPGAVRRSNSVPSMSAPSGTRHGVSVLGERVPVPRYGTQAKPLGNTVTPSFLPASSQSTPPGSVGTLPRVKAPRAQVHHARVGVGAERVHDVVELRARDVEVAVPRAAGQKYVADAQRAFGLGVPARDNLRDVGARLVEAAVQHQPHRTRQLNLERVRERAGGGARAAREGARTRARRSARAGARSRAPWTRLAGEDARPSMGPRG